MNKQSIIRASVLMLGLMLAFPTCKKETITPPTVKVFEGAIAIDVTSAGITAEVTDQGGAEVKSRGVVYGLSGGAMDTVFSGGGTGVFAVELNNLLPNTTYVYEAFAQNAGGMGTSGKFTFITKDFSLPTVTTGEVENVGTTTASCNGNVTDDGGGTVAERGICWGTEHNPSVNGNHADGGSGLGEFRCNMANLSGGTTYYVRAFAKNAKGTAYGEEKTFVTETQEYSITVSSNPSMGGTVSGGGTYQEGTSCTVTATANDGYAFTNWTENGNVVSTNANYTFTVTANRTLVVNFTANAPNQYTINVSANPAEGGTVSGGGTFNSGTSRTVTATANEGYTFTNWTENGNEVSTDANYTFTVTANRTLVANFTANAPNQYTINVLANPTDGGMVGGGGAYEQGDTCTVRTTANSGYAFINWTENGDEVSTSANYTFIVNGHRTLVANFEEHEPETYAVSISANPSNGGTVSGGGTFQQGQSCTVLANANSGFTFTNWTENGSVVSTSANYNFTVTGNRTLVAHFTQQSQAPTGAINGRFSVSSGQRVYFSQGNLQYKASTAQWRFATNQYDYIGSANSNISSSYSGWIDLFGWGTSGWNCGNTYYRPWDSNDDGYGSLYGPPGQYNLTGNYAHSDWGVHNAISNGGSSTGQWRTLTQSEWDYVFNSRSTSSGIRYAKATVNSVNGVILLPDDWSSSYYSLSNTNNSGASFSSNVISSSNWTNSLQAHGAVFLPAAGYRYGTSVRNVGSNGFYWSASFVDSSQAYSVLFYDGILGTDYWSIRYYGHSVRLVCPAE